MPLHVWRSHHVPATELRRLRLEAQRNRAREYTSADQIARLSTESGPYVDECTQCTERKEIVLVKPDQRICVDCIDHVNL